jgi:uncharacterized protein YecE (DUF72 family)
MSRGTLASASVGTSGFSYPTWRGRFYPEKARPADFLRLYAERLPAVELNATFYQLPSEEQLRIWADATPPEFRFAVKVTRRISHFGHVGLLAEFCERVRVLGEQLGPLLLQLPPTRVRDDGLLGLLLDSADPELRLAVEFRHESWDDPAVDDILAAHGAVRVNALEGPAPFRYLRLREPPYDESALQALAARVRLDLAAARPVFAFFKHEDEPTGAFEALRFVEILDG